jgi:hypothetical protein
VSSLWREDLGLIERLFTLCNAFAYMCAMLWRVIPMARNWQDVKGILGYLLLCAGIMMCVFLPREEWE